MIICFDIQRIIFCTSSKNDIYLAKLSIYCPQRPDIYMFSQNALSAKQSTCPHKPIFFALKNMLKYSFIQEDLFHVFASNLQNNFPSGRDPIPLRQSDSVLHVSFKSRCLVPSLPNSNSHQFVYNSDLRIFSEAVTVIWAFVIGLDVCFTCFWLDG